MKAIADTHVAIWYLWSPERLSDAALTILDSAVHNGEHIGLSAITLCEILYLVERGRFKADAFDLFMNVLAARDSLYEVLPLNEAVVLHMREIPVRIVPEMPDRIIAATALASGVPLITKDLRIGNSGVATIW